MTSGSDVTSFGRFGREALRVLFAARAELSRTGGAAVEPTHLLLALLKPASGSAHRVLTALGVDVETLSTEVEQLVCSGDQIAEVGELPLSSGTRDALERALPGDGRQADSVDVLLGVLHAGAGGAPVRLLSEQGITEETVTAARASL